MVVVLALLDVNGFVSARGINATGPGSDRNDLFATAQLGADWTPNQHFDLHVSGIGRHDALGTSAGLVEAYVDARAEFGLDEVQLRAGQFFLPTSRENKEALWTSPYTIHFSALNSWIGEEVRPVGVDLQYRHITSRGHAITTGATAFQGNDSMGALLAWRGWSIGNHLSTYNEVLPLPPVPFFPAQRSDGTKPFGSDLDGRTGYAARVRYSVPSRANVLYTYVDNRGDRELHRGEYAWATRFHLIGAEIGNPDRVVVASEYMRGKTGMGVPPIFVDANFYAAYVLVSGKSGRNRLTARYEMFNTEERDFSIAEVNEENGRAWTLAWFVDATPSLRLGGEFTQLVGDRVNKPDPDARSVTIEARYRLERRRPGG